jgi:hypothetical protein
VVPRAGHPLTDLDRRSRAYLALLNWYIRREYRKTSPFSG